MCVLVSAANTRVERQCLPPRRGVPADVCSATEPPCSSDWENIQAIRENTRSQLAELGVSAKAIRAAAAHFGNRTAWLRHLDTRRQSSQSHASVCLQNCFRECRRNAPGEDGLGICRDVLAVDDDTSAPSRSSRLGAPISPRPARHSARGTRSHKGRVSGSGSSQTIMSRST